MALSHSFIRRDLDWRRQINDRLLGRPRCRHDMAIWWMALLGHWILWPTQTGAEDGIRRRYRRLRRKHVLHTVGLSGGSKDTPRNSDKLSLALGLLRNSDGIVIRMSLSGLGFVLGLDPGNRLPLRVLRTNARRWLLLLLLLLLLLSNWLRWLSRRRAVKIAHARRFCLRRLGCSLRDRNVSSTQLRSDMLLTGERHLISLSLKVGRSMQ
jgi:hypothetical protein